jgi:DNA-binding response OmpR family regulator
MSDLVLAKHKILIVDDEQDNRDFLSKILSKNYQVITAADGDECVRLAKQENPTLILLDIQMPQMDGFDACQKLRTDESTQNIPVIMVSGTQDQERQIKSFDRGADDFVEKPYKIKDLTARIQSKIRRIEEKIVKNQIITCENLTLDVLKVEAKVDGERIDMSVLEFNLLKFFIDHKNQVLSRDRIMKSVWRSCVSVRSIDTHVCVMKSKLKGFNLEFVSVYGKGYVLRDYEEQTESVA